MKIDIEWLESSHECDDCGMSFASGANVRFDDVEEINMKPSAHCYNSVDYSVDEIYVAIIEKLGEVFGTHITVENANDK